MNIFYKICLVLLIVGGLNWCLVGIFQFDAVAWLFGGAASFLSRAIFTLVGAAAICSVPALFATDSCEGTSEKL